MKKKEKELKYSWKQFGIDLLVTLLALIPPFAYGYLVGSEVLSSSVIITIAIGFGIFFILLGLEKPSKAGLIYAILNFNIIMLIWWFIVKRTKKDELTPKKIEKNKHSKKEKQPKNSKITGLAILAAIFTIFMIGLIIDVTDSVHNFPDESFDDESLVAQTISRESLNDLDIPSPKRKILNTCGLKFSYPSDWIIEYSVMDSETIFGIYTSKLDEEIFLKITAMDLPDMTIEDYVEHMNTNGLKNVEEREDIFDVTGMEKTINTISTYELIYAQILDSTWTADIDEVIFIIDETLCSFAFMVDEDELSTFKDEINEIKNSIKLIEDEW